MWEKFKAFLDSLRNPVTVDQYMGLLRQAIPFIGGLLVAFGVSSGWVNDTGQKVLLLAGPLMTLAGIIWSMIANNKTSIIKAAAKMDETHIENGNHIIIDDPALVKAANTAGNKNG